MRVLHILPYKLTDVLDKGEVLDRYFNPCNVAHEIHFLSWRPMPKTVPDALQRMCGDAEVTIIDKGDYNDHVQTALAPFCVRKWEKLDHSRYDLVRATTRTDGWLAVNMNIPSLISIHSDRWECLEEAPWYGRPIFALEASRQIRICQQATKAVRVSLGLRHIYADAEWIPNMVANPLKRSNIGLSPTVVCVSREMKGKGFEPMRTAARRCGRKFVAIGGDNPHSNETVMHLLRHARVAVVRNHYPGLPKTVQEALLTGTPLVMNKEGLDNAPELGGAPIIWCEDTVAGYEAGIMSAWNRGTIDTKWAMRNFAPADYQWAQVYRETAR